jgi:hypothetical protein
MKMKIYMTMLKAVILCLLLYPVMLPASPGENNSVSINSKLHIPLPDTFDIQVSEIEEAHFASDTHEWLTAFFTERNINVKDNARFTLYIEKMSTPGAAGKDRNLSLDIEGQGNRINTFQARYEKDIGKKKKAIPAMLTYGVKARLEGPGGLTYWAVSVSAPQEPDSENISNLRLLEKGLNYIGTDFHQ